MKKCFTLLCISVIIAISNCSRIPENNDPILGIWSSTEATATDGKLAPDREEWIFNDAYLGRYHTYNHKKLEFYTDFNWEVSNGVYTIEYRGLDKSDAKLKLVEFEFLETLEFVDGGHFATRE